MTSSEEKTRRLLVIAETIAGWSTCIRFKVGAILTIDERIVSTGYNGSAPGAEHCTDHFADFDGDLPTVHHKWALQNEIHAEMNALLFAARYGIATEGATLITTLSPCLVCSKAIVQAGIMRVAYRSLYDETDTGVFFNNGVDVFQI